MVMGFVFNHQPLIFFAASCYERTRVRRKQVSFSFYCRANNGFKQFCAHQPILLIFAVRCLKLPLLMAQYLHSRGPSQW